MDEGQEEPQKAQTAEAWVLVFLVCLPVLWGQRSAFRKLDLFREFLGAEGRL